MKKTIILITLGFVLTSLIYCSPGTEKTNDDSDSESSSSDDESTGSRAERVEKWEKVADKISEQVKKDKAKAAENGETLDSIPSSDGWSDRKLMVQGQKITRDLQKTIGMALTNALNEGGVQNALKVCKASALPMTDSLANINGVKVRRLSSKVRNPINRPTPREETIITDFENLIQRNIKPKAKLISASDGNHLYYPIIISNPLCLRCHGKPNTEIQAQDFKLIQELYPADKAIDYRLGSLRGVWRISFPLDY